MSSSDILSQTLNSITSTKLEQVSKQRASFEEGKHSLLERVERQATQLDRVHTLLEGIEELPFMEKSEAAVSKSNVRRFLEQARCDPSVSLGLQKDWEAKLRKELDTQSLRFEYASLYGNLVEDWIESGAAKKPMKESEVGESFEQIGRKEMHEQRATWEAYVFEALDTDTEAINKYLASLFTSEKHITAALTTLREETRRFERSLARETCFTEASLKWCINGLLNGDLLSDAKKTILRDFSRNKTVLKELADVLNMRMAALDSWHWDPAGTPIEQRRNLNGRYRFYHDEDLLQSIFLRFIGVRWSVQMKSQLISFYKTEGVAKSSSTPVTKADKERREYFLGTSNEPHTSVEKKRANLWEQDVFLEQLQSRIEDNARSYDDSNSDDSDDGSDEVKSPLQVVQSVLHLLSTDIIMKSRLGEDVTVIRSDFKWFGPSMPHSTMYTVLKFFGISDKWTDFFRRAIEVPTKFTIDGADAPVRTRLRGTPLSSPLSDFLGESVLFCLDFAVNQNTNGARLFRLHDDIWFWGSNETCKKGWAAMQEYADLFGLEFSEEKTGSVRIPRAKSTDVNATGISHRQIASVKTSKVKLPQGPVRWGFLTLESNGRFMIDQKMIDDHIAELKTQLDACKSVFDWIQAWNIYAARFFSVNCLKPAACNGQAHVDEILQTFKRIQAKLFTSPTGITVSGTKHSIASVSDYLRQVLATKFGVKDVPEGYLYFPMKSGGLDLQNPFIPLYATRPSLPSNPDKYMDDFFSAEEETYKRDKARFDAGDVKNSHIYKTYSSVHSSSLYSETEFMSFPEYTRYREHTSLQLLVAFERLMDVPDDDEVDKTSDVSEVISHREWQKLKSSERWVMQLYAGEMIEKFGGLQVVERGLLPIGMVTMTRKSRFAWAG